MEIRTTISIPKETADKLAALREKYDFKSMTEVIEWLLISK